MGSLGHLRYVLACFTRKKKQKKTTFEVADMKAVSERPYAP